MNDAALLIVGAFVVLLLVTMNAIATARKARRMGELRFFIRGRFGEQIIKQADDPRGFEIAVMWLSAVPWIAFAMLALIVLFMGYFG